MLKKRLTRQPMVFSCFLNSTLDDFVPMPFSSIDSPVLYLPQCQLPSDSKTKEPPFGRFAWLPFYLAEAFELDSNPVRSPVQRDIRFARITKKVAKINRPPALHRRIWALP